MSGIRLTTKERKRIKKMMLGQKIAFRLKQRATLIWKLVVERMPVLQVAREVSVTAKTVRKWRDRFATRRIPGLEDAPRSGAPATFDAVQRCELIAIACDQPEHYGLAGQVIWTYDTLTEVVQSKSTGPAMSRSSVWRTLEQNALKPHRHTLWLHSKDPQFKEKVNEIVGLYHADLPDDVALCCVDEKTGMQANEKKYETQLPRVGRTGRIEYEYIRHGTQALLASFDVKTGEVVASCGAHRKADDLLAFMDKVAERYRHCRKIIIVWDNLNIHDNGPDERWTAFNEKQGNKFEFHYTPLHASWVNQIEIFFSILYKRCLRHNSFTSKTDLRQKVMAFIRRWNDKDGHPFHWTFRGYPIQDEEAM
ncbi:IS630 family transposase [Cohnella fermenti]|uniref:IS630 family transposase n=1 Tax=Cohnella fermenti TaxID=2565925 RepID=A0A4S4BGH3_9BACL|nr:IS630 family transposase [Cohnella fermenti]THF73335.1 IS630 family transposase [Cohnella fermenti]